MYDDDYTSIFVAIVFGLYGIFKYKQQYKRTLHNEFSYNGGIGSDQANIQISRDKPLLNGTFWCLKATFQGQKLHSIQKMHWINL